MSEVTPLLVLQQAREHLTPLEAWVKGEWYMRNEPEDTPRVCAMGAVILSRLLEDDTEAQLHSYSQFAQDLVEADPAYKTAVQLLAEAITEVPYPPVEKRYVDLGDGPEPSWQWEAYTRGEYQDFVIEFNDEAGRTRDEVLGVFDAAIEKARSLTTAR